MRKTYCKALLITSTALFVKAGFDVDVGRTVDCVANKTFRVDNRPVFMQPYVDNFKWSTGLWIESIYWKSKLIRRIDTLDRRLTIFTREPIFVTSYLLNTDFPFSNLNGKKIFFPFRVALFRREVNNFDKGASNVS